MEIPPLRDILYFDFEKASSIWSQLQWGKLEEFSVTTEESTDQRLALAQVFLNYLKNILR